MLIVRLCLSNACSSYIFPIAISVLIFLKSPNVTTLPTVIQCLFLVLVQNAGEASVANIDRLRYANGTIPTADLRLKMQKTMQNHAAVFRDGPTLEEGVRKMKDLNKEMNDLKVEFVHVKVLVCRFLRLLCP